MYDENQSLQRGAYALKRLSSVGRDPFARGEYEVMGHGPGAVCLVRTETPASSHLRVGPGRPNPVHEC